MTDQPRKELDSLDIYKDASGEWRWRRQAGGNNRILADSGEGYKNKDECIDDALRVNGGDLQMQINDGSDQS